MTTDDAGFGTGENSAERAAPLAAATAELPADKPRLVQVRFYLSERVIQAWPGFPLCRGKSQMTCWVQGVGAPDSVLSAVACGVDLFDSSYAHRATAAGNALTFAVVEPESGATASLRGGVVDVSTKLCTFVCIRCLCILSSKRGLTAGDAVNGGHSAAIDLADERHCESTAPLLPGCTCYTCSRYAHLTEVPQASKVPADCLIMVTQNVVWVIACGGTTPPTISVLLFVQAYKSLHPPHAVDKRAAWTGASGRPQLPSHAAVLCWHSGSDCVRPACPVLAASAGQHTAGWSAARESDSYTRCVDCIRSIDCSCNDIDREEDTRHAGSLMARQWYS
jgi:Queuine tRNA-ribosyltransferase